MGIAVMFRWRILPEKQGEFMRDWESVEEKRSRRSLYSIYESGFDYVLIVQFKDRSKGHQWLSAENWRRFLIKWGSLKLTGPEWLSMVTEPSDDSVTTFHSANGLSVEKITAATCDYFGISRTKIESSSRVREEAFVRRVAWWLSLKMLRRLVGSQINESEIGKKFKRERTTVIGGIKHISKLLTDEYVLPGPKKYPGPIGKSLLEVVDEIQTRLGYPPPGDPAARNGEHADT